MPSDPYALVGDPVRLPRGNPTVIDHIEALKLPVANIRLEAAKALSENGSDDRIKLPLFDRLDDEDPRVQVVAIRTMARFDDDGILLKLIGFLEHEETAIRCAAAEALGEIDDEDATLPLLKLVFDPEMEVHLAATEAVAKIEDERTVRLLKTALKEGATLQIRHRASLALQFLGVHHDRVLVNNPILASLQKERESFPIEDCLKGLNQLDKKRR